MLKSKGFENKYRDFKKVKFKGANERCYYDDYIENGFVVTKYDTNFHYVSASKTSCKVFKVIFERPGSKMPTYEHNFIIDSNDRDDFWSSFATFTFNHLKSWVEKYPILTLTSK